MPPMSDQDESRPTVLDPAQLKRIEAVHRGFLFQHLYAARSLLLTPGSDVVAIVVESDEDVEIVRANRRTYVQVKSRLDSLANSDVEAALQRFDQYRALHQAGERPGTPVFVIATNAPLTPSLATRFADPSWPKDVRIDYPDGPVPADPVTPVPRRGLKEAFSVCQDLAAQLPFAMLLPETLVWKLAGAVMMAASGAAPRTDHAFWSDELSKLFEQLVIQLHDFPAPPAMYRPQANEPPLVNDAPVRLVTGYSGAGKTAWVSQATLHVTNEVAYFDLHDAPGPSLASGLARELAARAYGPSGGGLGQILLPGASGLETLRGLGRRLDADGRSLLVVLDNVHSPSPPDVEAAIRAAPNMRFILLGQPGAQTQELSQRLALQAETLEGWSPDTIAAEVAASGCRADAAACQALLTLTGGLPLYVQNAVAVAAAEHSGDMAGLCASLSVLTHSVETAQELILARIIEALPAEARHALGVLSLSDIPLSRTDMSDVLAASSWW